MDEHDNKTGSQKQGGWTPGEWEISEARTVDDEFMVCGGEGQGFGLIATVTRKDDALLIAAAPALYAALGALEDAIDVAVGLLLQPEEDQQALATEIQRRKDMARAALSHANPSTDQGGE